MSTKPERFLTDVGRLVQGSLYRANTTDADGNALVYRTGEKIGQPRVNYYIAIAIPKKPGETSWQQTSWGRIIHAAGIAGFPQGQHLKPDFAWKMTDGDSMIPNAKGTRPCDCEGFPGNWIMKLGGSLKPKVCTAKGESYIPDENYVNLGDYIQVAGSVIGNESLQQPGVYLNPDCIAFSGYGERIVIGVDPKTVGFGQAPLPAGCSQTPLAQMPTQGYSAPTSPQPVNTAPPPYPQVLTPPLPAAAPAVPAPAPMRQMLPKAQGMSYESFIAANWTDELLIQHGYMVI